MSVSDRKSIRNSVRILRSGLEAKNEIMIADGLELVLTGLLMDLNRIADGLESKTPTIGKDDENIWGGGRG